MADEGFTELTFMNPKTGEKRVIKASLESGPIVDVLARAIEVFGTREKALRWLRAPVRSLGDKTPISLLNTAEGLARAPGTQPTTDWVQAFTAAAGITKERLLSTQRRAGHFVLSRCSRMPTSWAPTMHYSTRITRRSPGNDATHRNTAE